MQSITEQHFSALDKITADINLSLNEFRTSDLETLTKLISVQERDHANLEEIKFKDINNWFGYFDKYDRAFEHSRENYERNKHTSPIEFFE